jgi:uncharacterized protein
MKKIRTKLFEIVTQKVKAVAQQFDPNAEVILFGSRARGDYRKDSDWDFLILTDLQTNEPFKRELRDVICDVELETDQAITSFVENKKYWNHFTILPLFEDIKDDGISV